MITKKPANRKAGSSLFSNLLRRSIAPEQTIKPALLQEFIDGAGQFERILDDTGFMKLKRLTNEELSGSGSYCGLVERYLNLQPDERNFLLHDINFKEGIQVGNNYCQLFTLADAQDLPAYCGSRINYDKYSTDKQNSVLGLLHRLDSYYPAIISITNTSL